MFLPYCAYQGVDTPAAIDRRFLDRLSSRLLEEGGSRGPLSRFTVHSYLSSVNAFLTWAREVGDGVRAQRPKLPRHLVGVLTRDEIQRPENVAATERDKLTVRLLADTGVRVSERAALRTRCPTGSPCCCAGSPKRPRAVTRSGVEEVLRSLADRAGLAKPAHVQVFSTHFWVRFATPWVHNDTERVDGGL